MCRRKLLLTCPNDCAENTRIVVAWSQSMEECLWRVKGERFLHEGSVFCACEKQSDCFWPNAAESQPVLAGESCWLVTPGCWPGSRSARVVGRPAVPTQVSETRSTSLRAASTYVGHNQSSACRVCLQGFYLPTFCRLGSFNVISPKFLQIFNRGMCIIRILLLKIHVVSP